MNKNSSPHPTSLSSGVAFNNPAASCQLITVHTMGKSLSLLDKAWQFPNRLKRFLRRRISYIKNLICKSSQKKEAFPSQSASNLLQAGDLVQVKSREEIQETLNMWNFLDGCGFMEEMGIYCGTQQRVLKRVKRFLDERDYQVKKCKNLVILQGIYCTGTVDFGSCDRSCFFFWREEWLQKLPVIEREK